ncbi:hypothetical protein QTP88_008781 [Uroleucon formosanum]
MDDTQLFVLMSNNLIHFISNIIVVIYKFFTCDLQHAIIYFFIVRDLKNSVKNDIELCNYSRITNDIFTLYLMKIA